MNSVIRIRTGDSLVGSFKKSIFRFVHRIQNTCRNSGHHVTITIMIRTTIVYRNFKMPPSFLWISLEIIMLLSNYAGMLLQK